MSISMTRAERETFLAGVHVDPTNRPGVVVKMRPEKWIASDFAKQFRTPHAD